MSSNVADILKQVESLAPEEKTEVIRALLHGIDPDADTKEVEKSWRLKVDKRREEIISGKVKTLPHNELMAKLNWN